MSKLIQPFRNYSLDLGSESTFNMRTWKVDKSQSRVVKHSCPRKWLATTVTLAHLEDCAALFLPTISGLFSDPRAKSETAWVSAGVTSLTERPLAVFAPQKSTLCRHDGRGNNGRIHWEEEGCGLANSSCPSRVLAITLTEHSLRTRHDFEIHCRSVFHRSNISKTILRSSSLHHWFKVS